MARIECPVSRGRWQKQEGKWIRRIDPRRPIPHQGSCRAMERPDSPQGDCGSCMLKIEISTEQAKPKD